MADDSLRENLSQQQLVRPADGSNDRDSVSSCGSDRLRSHTNSLRLPEPSPGLSKRHKVTIFVLCYVNLINYMDRYTIAGILDDIANTFDMNESQRGLLQTAFVVVYMFMAPLYGYLGDRFNRKILLAVGIFIWELTTLIGSFMPNYGLFLVCRCIVGIGEASYSTIAPTIISDLCAKDLRSKVLSVFYFAIPVGSGLGYMVGASVTYLIEHSMTDAELATSEAWRWGLRVTPVLGLIALILILLLLEEPPRGLSEGGGHMKASSFMADLRHLATNRCFVLNTIAFTIVTFVTGALAWWGPVFVELGVKVQPEPTANPNYVPVVIGATAMVAGVVGVPLGSYIGRKFRVKYASADPIVCGAGLLISFPFLLGGIFLTQMFTPAAYLTLTLGQIFLNLNWAVVSDIVLYIVIPTRRSSAEAFQILISHAFGDAFSPYLIGMTSDALKPYIHPRNETIVSTATSLLPTTQLPTTASFLTTTLDPANDDYVRYKSLQYAMLMCCTLEILGGLFFFWSAVYIQKYREKCDLAISGSAVASSYVGTAGTSDLPQPTLTYADELEHEQTRQLIS